MKVIIHSNVVVIDPNSMLILLLTLLLLLHDRPNSTQEIIAHKHQRSTKENRPKYEHRRSNGGMN